MKNTIMMLSLCICLAFNLTAYAASCQTTKKHDYSGHFGDMDKNGDDFVDWEEFKAYFPHAEKKVFESATADGDGKIDHDEWHDFKDAHGYGHQEGKHHDEKKGKH
jgi:hypothetical protein